MQGIIAFGVLGKKPEKRRYVCLQSAERAALSIRADKFGSDFQNHVFDPRIEEVVHVFQRTARIPFRSAHDGVLRRCDRIDDDSAQTVRTVRAQNFAVERGEQGVEGINLPLDSAAIGADIADLLERVVPILFNLLRRFGAVDGKIRRRRHDDSLLRGRIADLFRGSRRFFDGGRRRRLIGAQLRRKRIGEGVRRVHGGKSCARHVIFAARSGNIRIRRTKRRKRGVDRCRLVREADFIVLNARIRIIRRKIKIFEPKRCKILPDIRLRVDLRGPERVCFRRVLADNGEHPLAVGDGRKACGQEFFGGLTCKRAARDLHIGRIVFFRLSVIYVVVSADRTEIDAAGDIQRTADDSRARLIRPGLNVCAERTAA